MGLALVGLTHVLLQCAHSNRVSVLAEYRQSRLSARCSLSLQCYARCACWGWPQCWARAITRSLLCRLPLPLVIIPVMPCMPCAEACRSPALRSWQVAGSCRGGYETHESVSLPTRWSHATYQVHEWQYCCTYPVVQTKLMYVVKVHAFPWACGALWVACGSASTTHRMSTRTLEPTDDWQRTLAEAQLSLMSTCSNSFRLPCRQLCTVVST